MTYTIEKGGKGIREVVVGCNNYIRHIPPDYKPLPYTFFIRISVDGEITLNIPSIDSITELEALCLDNDIKVPKRILRGLEVDSKAIYGKSELQLFLESDWREKIKDVVENIKRIKDV